jgi:tape measure domain-containing protein
MAVELATGYISLVPSAKGIGRSLSRELSGPLEAAGRDAGDKATNAFSGRFTAGLKLAAKNAGIALGVAFGAAGTYGVKVAADFQQTRIAFEGILGSADEANKRLTELQQFAAGTPFEFKGLAESAQQLLAVGFTADEIIPTMTKLGNVAATLGVGEAEIKGVVRALGQMRGKGKASAEELQQISEQIPGFSAIGAIAEDMGISTAEAFEQMAKGAIPADKAIEAILAGMEKFPGAAGAMERQSKTLNGVLSTFKDTINIALIQGIEPFLPAISGALAGSIPIVQKFIDVTIGGVAAVVTGFGDMADAVGSFFDEINAGDVGGGIAVEIGHLVGLAEDHPIISALATALSAVGDAVGYVADRASEVVSFVAAEVSGSVDVAREAWQSYAQDGVGPVADAFDRIVLVGDEVTRILTEHKEVLIPAAAAAASFGAALLVFVQASRGLAAITVAAQAISVALTGIGLAIGGSVVAIVVAAIVAIGAAFAAAYFHIQPFRDAVDSTIDVVGAFAGEVIEAVKGFAQDALPTLERIGGAIVGFGEALVDGFGSAVGEVGGLLQRNVIKPLRPLARFISSEILPTFEAFGELVGAVFDRLGDAAGPAIIILRTQFEFFAGVFSDVVGPALDFLVASVTAAMGIVRVQIETIANVVAPILGVAFDLLATAIDVAFGIIAGIAQAFFGVIEGVFTAITGLIQGDFGKVWQGLTQIIGAPIGAARDIVVNTFEETIAFLGSIPGRLGDFASAIFGGAVATATAIFDGVSNIVTTTFDGIVEFVTGLPERIATAASGMWDGIAEAFEEVINFIIGAWNDLEFTLPSKTVFGQKIGGFTLGTPKIDPVDFADGGVVTARPGGLIGRLGEAGRDELVAPLPNGFDIADLAGSSPLVGELTVIANADEDPAQTTLRGLRKVRLLAGA